MPERIRGGVERGNWPRSVGRLRGGRWESSSSCEESVLDDVGEAMKGRTHEESFVRWLGGFGGLCCCGYGRVGGRVYWVRRLKGRA